MIEQPPSPSKEEYISLNNISDESAMDSEENELSDEDDDDDDRNHKHRRREPSRLPVPNEDNTPAEQPSTVQTSKKRARPFEQSTTKFDKRRFRNNNNQFHGRGRGRNNSHPLKWGPPPPLPPPPLEMHDLAMMASGSWGGFGFVPGIGNGMHPIGGPAMVAPPMMELGLPHQHQRQRCPDFEELGYCLRGDMCPMEHGVNRIVVEDVQSLSQLKLLGVGVQPQPDPPLPAVAKPPVTMKDARANGGGPDAADVYDPDQPLWTNNQQPMTSNNQQPMTSNNQQPMTSNNQQPMTSNNQQPMTSNNQQPMTSPSNNINDMSYQPDPGPSVWGRIGKTHRGKDSAAPPASANNNTATARQRASRTLYICGIPHKDNRRDALFAHFRKFGHVIDIHIPSNSEKAFVQFAKREEAEAALVAPDAVMGNRFIKVLWANRDRFADEAAPMALLLPPISQKAKGGASSTDLVAAKAKGRRIGSSSSAEAAAAVGTSTAPKPPPPPQVVGLHHSDAKSESAKQKKLESMELLEELRKKQDILARKRDEFKQQLQMLEKQAGGGKKVENGVTVNKVETASESPRNGNITRHEAMHTAADKRNSKDMNVAPSNCRVNKFKIDNRPVQFRILPPLPQDISDVSVLKEHFSSFGEVACIEVDDKGTEKEKEREAARVRYTRHEAAERAYISGTSVRGHSLTFKWVPTKNSNSNTKMIGNSGGGENVKAGTGTGTGTAGLPSSKHPAVQTQVERSLSPSPSAASTQLVHPKPHNSLLHADPATLGAVQD